MYQVAALSLLNWAMAATAIKPGWAIIALSRVPHLLRLKGVASEMAICSRRSKNISRID